MSLTKFLLTIEKSPIGKFFDFKRRLIEGLNPERIYVENVRHIFNIPHFAAKMFCEMAVVEGIFKKKYGIECPNDECNRLITSVDNIALIPDLINCTTCEMLERDEFVFTASRIKTIPYYILVK